MDDSSTSTGLTGSDFQIKTPPADSDGAPSANSIPSGTSYLSVLANGSATYTFASGVTGIEFDWGSIDKYNTLTINSSDGGAIVIPGDNFINASDGNQTSPGTNGLFTITGNAGEWGPSSNGQLGHCVAIIFLRMTDFCHNHHSSDAWPPRCRSAPGLTLTAERWPGVDWIDQRIQARKLARKGSTSCA